MDKMRSPAQRDPAMPRPDAPLIVIGDIHGSLKELDALLALIGADPDLAALEPGQAELVFVGDLVDRGPDSAGVIRRIRALELESPWRVRVLMGNHEAMMLGFLEAPLIAPEAEADEDGAVSDPEAPSPLRRAARWLIHGGREMAASYGVDIPEARELDGLEDGAIDRLRQALVAAIGPEELSWLRALPRLHLSGNVVVVHAAYDPKEPPEDQDEDLLIWGERRFLRRKHTVPPWIIHGHTITRPAQAFGCRIAVDSGAYLSGELTAAVILPGQAPRLISTGDALQ